MLVCDFASHHGGQGCPPYDTYFTKNNMPRYLEKPNRRTKFLYENCLDKNGTFKNIEEYIVFHQQMKIINKITASEERKFGYGNHNSVDINVIAMSKATKQSSKIPKNFEI